MRLMIAFAIASVSISAFAAEKPLVSSSEQEAVCEAIYEFRGVSMSTKDDLLSCTNGYFGRTILNAAGTPNILFFGSITSVENWQTCLVHVTKKAGKYSAEAEGCVKADPNDHL